ncbi:MAG TPA: hypothetical protein VLA90_03350, partial [Actinomycetota bacterium]|nr:hypothetical protein [Actinomycetota bacterium]
RVVTEARREADRISADAQSHAEKARADAERALGQAPDEADRTISGLSTRRQLLVDQLAQMRERLLGVARDLESAIVAPAEPPGEPDEPVEERVVDVRDDPAASAPLIVADEILEAADPTAEELWEGTETIQLDLPEIPPLDLSWGDDADDDRS